MVELVPAILTRDKNDLEEKIRFLESIPEIEEVHIDFEDAEFVPNLTILPPDFPKLETRLKFEAHLMVSKPQDFFHVLQSIESVKTLILHLESFRDTPAASTALENVRRLGFRAGVALNPNTAIESVLQLVSSVELIQIMGVFPGFQGRKFIPETFQKISTLRNAAKNVIICVDGGVKLDNAEGLRRAGADRIVVGSAIWLERDPKQTIYEFLKKIK